jgi:hypothetical protein
MTIVTMGVMGFIQALAMYVAFTKFSNMFQPSKIQTKIRHKQRIKRILGR